MELTREAQGLYEQEEIAKLLATADAEGKVNVALIISLVPGEPGKLAFGEFMMWKTRDNLNANNHIASLAMTPGLEWVEVTGDFEGFTDTGPYVDKINSMDFFRYMAYAYVRRVGFMDINRVTPLRKVSYPAVLKDYLALKLALTGVNLNGSARGVEIPKAVSKKVNSIMSICALAFMGEDSYPRLLPVLATSILDGGYLAFKITDANRDLEEIDLPLQVAMNVITLEPTSYQLKGKLERMEPHLGSRLGLVRIEEVYSSMPPLCGERIA